MAEKLTAETLSLDCDRVADEIAKKLRDTVVDRLKKKGAVVGISGGIDSSLVTALCARALGPKRVIGLLMPERDSADETLALSQSVADSQGVSTVLEEITPILEAARCYERRDEAIARTVEGYGPGWKSKIVLPTVLDNDRYRIFSVVAESPTGEQVTQRMSPAAYLQVVASTNFKQRTRKMMEYYHADRLNYAVAGTPNRLEYDQGFFVKGGDGLADVKPIAHLYKTQVYQLAAHLGIPKEVCSRAPTTDTYSLAQGQDEFYFSLPYQQMDLCLYAKNNGYSLEEAADALGLRKEHVERVYRDIDTKRSTTQYLHLSAILLDDVPEIKR